jgi:hypothetical protein
MLPVMVSIILLVNVEALRRCATLAKPTPPTTTAAMPTRAIWREHPVIIFLLAVLTLDASPPAHGMRNEI